MVIPDWLEKDFQFNVEGSECDYSDMCAALDFAQQRIDADFKLKLEESGLLGAYLQWIVRMSKNELTGGTNYLSRTVHPVAFRSCDFNIDILTNAIRRITGWPVVARMTLIYDDLSEHSFVKKDSVLRAVPGIDYPGIHAEDFGSTPYNVFIRLQAPKYRRKFKIQVTAFPLVNQEYEFAWISLRGLSDMPNCFWRKTSRHSACAELRTYDMSKTDDIIAVFARIKNGLWGPPSFIHIVSDSQSKRVYTNEEIDSVDYGGFKDDYILGAKGHIIGFVRTKSGCFEREKYLNASELILEEYSDENPKLTANVEYYEEEGRLQFKVIDKKNHYRCDDTKKRICNW